MPARTIWVDADACPGTIKDILFRAAQRVGIDLVLVANQPLKTPPCRHIRTVRVAAGFDMADKHIEDHARTGDLVVTADIPLAAAVVARGCLALNPRGERYDADNVRQRLNMRDFMDTLRASGVSTGGPATFGQAERRAFANQLDRYLNAP